MLSSSTDTSAHPSLHANQIQLKKAVTADHLSKKIASRPGPLMLIQKGILNPADHGLVGAVKQVPLPTGEESEEMIAAEAMQQQQQKKRYQQRHSVATMGGWGAQGSSNGTTTSPFHSGEWGKLVSGNSPISRSMSADVVDDVNGESRRKGSSSSSLPSPPDFISLESPAHSPSGGSVGVRSPPTARSFPSSQINAFGRNSGKVPTVSPKLCKKQVKSKREKFRFHVYQPPNQKRNLKDVPQKQQSPYSLLVQQQQILLQLQVLQQQHPEMMNTGINFPPIPQDCSPQQHMQILLQTLSKMTAHINQDKNNQGVSSGIPTSKSSPPFVVPTSEPLPTSKDSSTLSLMGLVSNSHKGMSTSNSHYSSESVLHCDNGKTVKFEDVRVNQLKDACKEKKLVMSGKKADLIERLLEHNNGVLPASVIDRKDVGPDTNRITTPQESSSGVPTTSPVFKFPNNSDSVITSTRPSLPIKHIRKMQDKFDEVNQLKKLNYISSGRNYPGSIAPMPDTIPASFTAQQQQQQQQQKLSNHVATTSNVANSTSSSVITNSTSRQSVSESHQPLIKKKSLSEPSSPTLSPSPSTLNLLTEMIGDNSNLLNPSVLRQQLGGVKEHFTNQQQHFNGVLPNGSSHQQQQQQQPISAANVGMGGSVVYRNNKGAPPHINQRPNRNSLPMLPPYMPTGGGGVPTAAAAMKSLQQQNNTPANASDFDFHDSGMYMRDTNHLPPGDSSELMDVRTRVIVCVFVCVCVACVLSCRVYNFLYSMIACYSMLFCFLIDVIEHIVGIFINLVSKKELMVLRRKKLTCSWQAIHTIVMTSPSLKL